MARLGMAKCAGKSVGEGPGVGWISRPSRSSCPLFEGRLEGAIHHHCPPLPRSRPRVILACPPKTGNEYDRDPKTIGHLRPLLICVGALGSVRLSVY